MILIGQFDSPFVRRVGIALTLYNIRFTHQPWSVFGDAEKIRPYNPLIRVPTLVLEGGETLIDSHMILDFIDRMVPVDRAMYPLVDPSRRRALRIATLATGVAEKAVSLFYEKLLHRAASDVWVDRCRAQIAGTLAALETDRIQRTSEYWFGNRIGHADIAVAVALRFLNEAHPGLISMADYPYLAAHAAKLEALPVFQQIAQPFVVPA
jgi:glutathione S-transferase